MGDPWPVPGSLTSVNARQAYDGKNLAMEMTTKKRTGLLNGVHSDTAAGSAESIDRSAGRPGPQRSQNKHSIRSFSQVLASFADPAGRDVPRSGAVSECARLNTAWLKWTALPLLAFLHSF